MAFNAQEQEIIRAGRELGKSSDEVKNVIMNYRLGIKPSSTGKVAQQMQPTQPTNGSMNESYTIPGSQFKSPLDTSLGQVYQGGAESIGREITEAGQRYAEEPTMVGKTAELGMALAGVTAETLKTAFTPIGMAIGSVADKISDVKGVQEFASKESVGKGLDALTDMAGKIFQNWSEFERNNPRLAQGIADNAEILLAVAGEEPATKIVKGTGEALKTTLKTSGRFMSKIADDLAKGTLKYGDDLLKRTSGIIDNAKLSLFGRGTVVKSVDDVIRLADDALTPSQTRAMAEAQTALPNIAEKWVGISNDIKNRIAGKADKLKEYFDVAHARNNFDVLPGDGKILGRSLPTPLEHGAKQVQKAVDKMEELLGETGGQIGSFRKKIGTYNADFKQMKKVEDSFLGELEKLNLGLEKGTVKQKAGTIKKLASDAELKVINDIYRQLKVIKQNPSLQKLIDLRTLLDKKISFGKSARDISNTIDPFSRGVRKSIADVAAEIVGKTEASKLKEFSAFMDAYNQLKSFTDRKAGAEFLLKQVLSERGRVPGEIMAIIKQFTGIDLMDDAVMSVLATDLIGNIRQKGVFRQEVAKAGLDAVSALTGSKSGIMNLINNVVGKVINEEKIYLKAAK